MAARSRSTDPLPRASHPRLQNNEAEGRRESVGLSHAGTSLLVPWRGFASASLAPMFLPLSCWNNLELVGCCSLCRRLFLAMVAGKKKIGGTQLSSSVGCSPGSVPCTAGVSDADYRVEGDDASFKKLCADILQSRSAMASVVWEDFLARYGSRVEAAGDGLVEFMHLLHWNPESRSKLQVLLLYMQNGDILPLCFFARCGDLR